MYVCVCARVIICMHICVFLPHGQQSMWVCVFDLRMSVCVWCVCVYVSLWLLCHLVSCAMTP